MTFEKYPVKKQIILALIFTPLNILISYLSTAVQFPFFMDMIFVYAASFFGLPCGIIVGAGTSLFNSIFVQHTIKHSLYAICCITGTIFTWLLITRYRDFELLFIRLMVLVFLSTIVISLEGSLIYYFFFSNTVVQNENSTVMFLIYTLVLQDFGLIISAFLARLPVNLSDKAIAVFAGFGIYLLSKLCVKASSSIAKKS